MSDGSAPPPLVGRARDLERADDALAAARTGTGRLLALEGPWGAGKTRMLDEIAHRAAGFRVLRARGLASEQGFALGVARDLFESDPALDRSWSRGEVGDAVRALVQMTLARAARVPLVLAVDDLHWADEPSLRYLGQLASRMSASRVLMVLAWRAAEPGASRVETLLGSAGESLPLEPLDDPAIADLLERANPDWSRLAVPVRIAGAGQPLLTVELCRCLAAQTAGAAEASSGVVGELAPEGLVRRVGHRLASYGPAATSLAGAVSVLGADAGLRLVATVAKLELEDAARVSDKLTSAGLLAPAAPLAFVAPVLRNVTYETIPRGQRALLHLAAARALAAAGVGEEAVIAHLMRSEPAGDAHALTLLRRAAGQARGAGELGRTASLLARAAAEAPAERERNEVLLELGLVEATLRLPEARAHLEQVRRGGGQERGAATLALADLELLGGRPHTAAELLRSVSAGLREQGRDLELKLAAELEACEIAAGAAHLAGERGAGIDETIAATPGERARMGLTAAKAALAGRRRAVVLELAAGAWDGLSMFPDGPLGAGASLLALLALETVEPLPADAARIEAELIVARAQGSVVWEAVLLTLRARALLGRGPLSRVEADARRALALSGGHALALVGPFALAALVEALLDQGRLADAQDALVAYAPAEDPPHDLGSCLVTIARGRLQAAAGAAHHGMRSILAAGAHLLRTGSCTPGYDWRSRAGLLAQRLDHHAEAWRLIDDELALARRIGAPRAIGRALRAQALLAPAARQIDLLEESVEILRGTSAKLDCARSLCDLGAARRRSGARSRGREPLLDALQLAHECEAVALAQRTRHELIALGARPRRHAVTGVDALTAREREASELAAQGLTNRQIAAVMTVTPNTVEYHLTNAYRKLGITTREHLAAELGISAPPSLLMPASHLGSQAQTA